MTFVVRVTRDRAGRLAGIVERVRTGEKHRFAGIGALGRLLEQALGALPAMEGPS